MCPAFLPSCALVSRCVLQCMERLLVWPSPSSTLVCLTSIRVCIRLSLGGCLKGAPPWQTVLKRTGCKTMETHLANHGDTTQFQPLPRPQSFSLLCSSCSQCRDVARISFVKGAILGSIYCKHCQSSRKSLKWLCECRPCHTYHKHRKMGMACQGSLQSNRFKKRLHPPRDLGSLGGG